VQSLLLLLIADVPFSRATGTTSRMGSFCYSKVIAYSPMLVTGRSRNAATQSMTERREPCLRNLHVALRGIEARTNAADRLTVDDDRQPALHLDETTRSNSRGSTVIYCIFAFSASISSILSARKAFCVALRWRHL
jgi:hypothetical protein